MKVEIYVEGTSDKYAIILGNAKYQDIAEQCPQGFGFFVDFLENI
ncbi:hypothetical protein PQG02_05250 [Nostoc sp. UHCC 0926]|nr:hypothetical protein [Nostoc sp. UHCC 0926]WDD33781.1 hypothetical protein PQG02_05250 [Nostoc sp. UHCC 0926]